MSRRIADVSELKGWQELFERKAFDTTALISSLLFSSLSRNNRISRNKSFLSLFPIFSIFGKGIELDIESFMRENFFFIPLRMFSRNFFFSSKKKKRK